MSPATGLTSRSEDSVRSCFRENPPGGGSFVRGRRWLVPYSPLRGGARGQGRLGQPLPAWLSWGFRPRFRRPLRDAWLNFDEFPGVLPLANLRCPGGTFDCGRCARPPWNAEAGTVRMRNAGCGNRGAKRGFYNMLWPKELSNVSL